MSAPIPAASGYCAVVPTYNNHLTVAQVLRRVLEHVETVIVVNDGCTDDTLELIKGLPVIVVSHPRNHGKGAALRTGFRKAFELGYTHAITLDSDGQHYPEEIPKLHAASLAEPDAFVIGKRDMTHPNVPRMSAHGREFSNFWIRLATGVNPGDAQSGFRIYPLRHVLRLRHLTSRFTYECELLVRAAWAGCPIIPVDVEVYYPPRHERVSHFNPLWDNVRFFFLYNYLNFRHLLIPLPHARLVPRKEPLWDGTLGGTLKANWRRLRELMALPPEAQFKGGPIARFRQLVRYLMQENSSSGNLAMATGIGAFIGCTPFFGIQTLLAIYGATRMHLNRVACVAASQISFGPFAAVIALASIATGKTLLGQRFVPPATWNWATAQQFIASSVGAWFLGSLVIGLLAAFVVGLGTKFGLDKLRAKPAPETLPEPLPTPTPEELAAIEVRDGDTPLHGLAPAEVDAALSSLKGR